MASPDQQPTQPRPRPNDAFFRLGNIRLSRGEFILASYIAARVLITGVGAYVTGRILSNLWEQSRTSTPEQISLEEQVRGSLIAAYDEYGNTIQDSRVSGTKLITVVKELPAQGVKITEIESTANAPGLRRDDTDNPGGWPIAKKLSVPNLGTYYVTVYNLDHINSGLQQVPIPYGPFEISTNVSGVLPTGQVFKRNGEPGPIHYTRI